MYKPLLGTDKPAHESACYRALMNHVPYTRIYPVGSPITYNVLRLPKEIREWAKRLRRRQRAIQRMN